MTTRVSPDAILGELAGLRALARSLVHGDAEAEDLLQETAIAALRHPPADDRPARPWLATVLRNHWRMDRRAAARRRERELGAVVDDAPAASAEDSLERVRVLEQLSRALAALDEPLRVVVIRRYLDGESAADIARALGIPAGTVRWRLKTGLARLRAALDDTTPRWQRALVPLSVGKGALAVKAKTSLLWLAILVLALGGAMTVMLGRGDDTSLTPTSSAGSGRVATHAAGASAPVASSRGGDAGTGPAAVVDPLPGQGKVTVEAVPGSAGAVSGRVINWSTGDGVADAELTFTGDAGAVTVRTRGDGGFELAPDAQGRYVLTTVSASGFLPYAPELEHSGVHAFVAKARAVRGLTVFLFPAVDYFGKVIDARGAPVVGAHVRLLGTEEQVIDKLATEWTTDAKGEFVFHAADDAVLEAELGKARGWARLDGKVAITKHLEIRVDDAVARDLAIRGRTVGSDGEPMPGVLVRAIPDDAPGKEPASPRAPALATSGADGTFVLDHLDRGTYVLLAEDEGRAPLTKPGVRGGSSGVVLTLDRGQPLGGRVVAASGEAIPAFTLLVLRREGLAGSLVAARSIIEPDGRFALRVAPGDYELVASASGWAPSTPVTVAAGTTDATLTVSAGATLRGIIVDKATGEPLANARVMREGQSGGASAIPANAGTVTREDGTFELTGLRPGPVAISIGAGDYHPRVEAGLVATDGGTLGPLTIALTKLADGEQPSLELVGIGVKLAPEGDGLRVDGVIAGGGAAAAGVLVGDRLVALDGVPVTSLGFDGAIGRIRGAPGTTIAITLMRGDQTVQLVVERKPLRA